MKEKLFNKKTNNFQTFPNSFFLGAQRTIPDTADPAGKRGSRDVPDNSGQARSLDTGFATDIHAAVPSRYVPGAALEGRSRT